MVTYLLSQLAIFSGVGLPEPNLRKPAIAFNPH
jgi:hypothetical protein